MSMKQFLLLKKFDDNFIENQKNFGDDILEIVPLPAISILS